MPEIMSIEGYHGSRTMKNYDLPLIDGMGFAPSTADLKEMVILGGVGAGAHLLGDLTNLYPKSFGDDQKESYAKYARPALRVLLGVASYYGLRRFSPQAAMVGAGLLVGSAIYQLAKPSIGKIEALGLGKAVKDGMGLGDILIEQRPLLGQLPAEQLWGLGEVRQEQLALPPAMGEMQQDEINGLEDELEDEDEDEGFSPPPDPGVGAWLT